MSMTATSGLLNGTVPGDNVNTNPQVLKIIEQMQIDGIKSLDYFAQQVVGQTILEILATDHRHAMFTTFDKAAVDGTTQRIVDSVKKYWDFKWNYF